MKRGRIQAFKFLIILAAFVLTGSISRAQSPTPSPSPSPPSLESEFLKNIVRDQKAIWTAPLRLHRADSKWLVPASIGTMALITTDRITGDEIGESDAQVHASHIVSYAGSVYGTGAIAATFYLIGRSRNDTRARETGILTAEAIINSSIVGGVLKGITQRARPADGRDRSEFFDGGSSFPSGHSLSAWSAAAVIASEYHDNAWVKVAAYGVAGAVSVARFTGQKHYLSDVLVGSAAGYAIGKYVYHAHHRDVLDSDPEDRSKLHWPTIVPEYNRHQYGIGLSWSF
ncbi:MAG TPA: phosphatase PAP2 family protein [Pyrinomonadaceae bacterium]|nr:phosphatase PAP2 family protein [Pyrinomonadaceae bacterium]